MPENRIGHNPNLNKWRAVLVAFMGVIPLILAGNLARFLDFREFYLVAILAAIGLAILFWAWRIWRTAPASRAELSFHESGFSIAVNAPFNRFAHDIAWSEVADITLVLGGYGARALDFRLTHEGALRIGLVQPTTRKTAPRFLVRRRLSVPLPMLELGREAVIARLEEAARAEGFALEKTGYREYLALSYTPYSITPLPETEGGGGP